MRSIVVEDQTPAQNILRKYISDTNGLELEKIFCDALHAKAYLKEHPVDLIFLDINLPRCSGIDFLKSDKNHPLTILTTAHAEFALECYQFNIVDYLLKPFSFERFSQAVEKVMAMKRAIHQIDACEKETEGYVYVKSSHDLVRVKNRDILFIKSDSDYTEVVTADAKHLTLDALKDWAMKLGDDFRQVHKSYIINFKHVTKISKNKVLLGKEHIAVPIGRAFKKNFMNKVKS